MKREILFRGKRADNGELVYGSLITNYHEAITKYFITTNGMGQIYATSFEVIPETIGQFTGLTDKNGVKIFEGDILSEKWKAVVYISIDGTYKVRFTLNPKYNKPQTLKEYISRRIKAGCPEDFLLIGNIHDNPELLK